MGTAVRQLRCVVCQTPYTGSERFCPIDGGAIVATASGEAAADGYVGKTIDGRYLVRRLIGKGGMGAVYEADHVGLDRRVALKLMLGTIDADALARFRREARAASKVVHPNVVQIFDVGTDDDNLDYIVMEFLDGEDLNTVISTAVFKAGGGFSTARAVNIAVQLLRGLSAIHAAGIVHRDIKPANVLLLDGDVVKLTDFGIAKSTDAKATALTDTGRVIGTVKYMSPEQLSGHPPDPRSDLYAVGLVLYEILAGKAPFESEASAELAAMHFSEPAPSLAGARPDASPELVAVLERVLAKTPDARFADANAFIEALEAAPVSDEAPEPIDESPNVTRPASARGREKIASSEQPTKVDRTTGGTPAGSSRDSVPSVDNGDRPQPERGADTQPVRALASGRSPVRYVVGAVLALLVGVGIALAVRGIGRDDHAVAPAPPPVVAPSEADTEIAKGQAAENAGKLDIALAHYRLAYDADARPPLLYRIGDLQQRLGQNSEALASFRDYVAKAPAAPDVETVKARIAMLEAPTGAAVDAGVREPADSTAVPGKTIAIASAPAVPTFIKLPPNRTGCTCDPNDPVNGSNSLCAVNTKQFMCRCMVPQSWNSSLCTSFTNGECDDKHWGDFSLSGHKPGEKCRGRLTRDQPEVDGEMDCQMVCPKGLWFRGPENTPCAGWGYTTGVAMKGHVDCGHAEPEFKKAAPAPKAPDDTKTPSATILLGGAKLAPGERGCFCHPNDSEKGGTMGLCPKLAGLHRCVCKSDDGQWGSLCTGTFSGATCAAPKTDLDATPGDVCLGRGLPDKPLLPGHYDCQSECAVDKFTYVGREGQACRGYVSWSGELLDGSLDCDDANVH